MIKLIGVEREGGCRLRLRFSDGAWGVFDFTPFIAAHTEMTAPLVDPELFGRCFIECGALVWPNGFDLSAGSLYQGLREDAALRSDSEAA